MMHQIVRNVRLVLLLQIFPPMHYLVLLFVKLQELILKFALNVKLIILYLVIKQVVLKKIKMMIKMVVLDYIILY